MNQPRWISNKELFAGFGYGRAIQAITQTLTDGFNPSLDKPRTFVDFQQGQGLVMPSEIGQFAGLKFVTVAPDNPALGQDRIQGIYSLFDARTLSPLAQCDGAALTLLRTASVTAAMLQKLKVATSPKVAVFGSGPQALAHILATGEISQPSEVSLFARNQQSGAELIAGLALQGIEACLGTPTKLAEADLIITATTARSPLFTLSEIKPDCVIAAVGSHEAAAREIGSDVVRVSQVFIEEQEASLREAGDIVLALLDQSITEESLIEVRGLFFRAEGQEQIEAKDSGIRFYKSTGMPWQDLAIFAEAFRILKQEKTPSTSSW